MVTTLQVKSPGQRVNLEVDMIGKYVERFVSNYLGGKAPNAVTDSSSILKKLKEEGFIL
ncbi:hypothetical protein MBAV_000016 [Candidatus Magnetobacterium bavaricum]|uniref:Riboflavin synthase n=1 Tax=Candidatus Magnetobacterium bavaricum TaxID=29290 RepID=A0A0F3H0S2_9BACT|nr:hypothetical protein MBAV_000016 [Candidatus Magnetobacterium bavaricum]